MNPIESIYQNYCTVRFPLPTLKQLLGVENRLGVLFPANYRDFLLKYNGGYFDRPSIVSDRMRGLSDSLDVLDGIGATVPSAELGSPSSMSLIEDNTPPYVVPIGYTVCGNLLLLVTGGDESERGSILLKLASTDEYLVLASSIGDFCRLLSKSRS